MQPGLVTATRWRRRWSVLLLAGSACGGGQAPAAPTAPPPVIAPPPTPAVAPPSPAGTHEDPIPFGTPGTVQFWRLREAFCYWAGENPADHLARGHSFLTVAYDVTNLTEQTRGEPLRDLKVWDGKREHPSRLAEGKVHFVPDIAPKATKTPDDMAFVMFELPKSLKGRQLQLGLYSNGDTLWFDLPTKKCEDFE